MASTNTTNNNIPMAEAETEVAASTSSNNSRQQLIKRLIKFVFNFWGCIPLIIVGVRFECPAIESMQAFLITLGVLIAIVSPLKLAVNYPVGERDMEGKKKFKEEHPKLYTVIDVLGLSQLLVGIWGIVITLSNLDLYGNLCQKDDEEVCTTCAKSSLVSATIASVIFLLIIIFMFVMIAKAIAAGKFRKDQEEQKEVDEDTNKEIPSEIGVV